MPPETSEVDSYEERLRKTEEAEKRAAKSTDILVHIPSIRRGYPSRWECRIQGKRVKVMILPPIRRFEGGVSTYEGLTAPSGARKSPAERGIRPLTHECIYTFTVDDESKGEKTKEIKIVAESIDNILNLYSDKMSAEKQSLIIDVLTMPIEGKDRESLAAVLHIFHPSYFRGIGDKFRGGHNPEFYYETLLNGLLLEYQKATNKKYFLLRLFRWLKEFHTTKKDGETHAIDAYVSKFLPQWFANNRALFNAGSGENLIFEAGFRALPYWPDEDGTYTVKDSMQIVSSIIPPGLPSGNLLRYTDAPNTIYIKYNIARGEWEWWPSREKYRTNPGRDETTPWDTAPQRVEDVAKFAILKWNNAGFQSLTPEHVDTLWKLLSALPWDERFLWVEQNKVGSERQKSFDAGVEFLKNNGFVFLSHRGTFAKCIDDTYVMVFRCFKEGGWQWSYIKYGTERYVASEGSSVGGRLSAELGQWSSLTNFPLFIRKDPNRNYDPGKPYLGPREWEIYEPPQNSSVHKKFKTILDAFRAKVGGQ